MSSLWTPSGEHRVPDDEPTAPGDDRAAAMREAAASEEVDDGQYGPEELAELQRELVEAPVEAIIANHCYGFFQLAALHLSQRPAHLEQARLAIDALSAVVDALGERFGPSTEALRDALAQIRLAYVQIAAAQPTGNGSTPSEEPAPGDSAE